MLCSAVFTPVAKFFRLFRHDPPLATLREL
jgi:hypothetical protein